MKVIEIMERKPIVLAPTTTYEEATSVLYSNDVSGAPVVGENGELVGMLSLKDLFRILYPFYSSYYDHPESYSDQENRESKVNEVKKKLIKEFMSTRLITIQPHMPVMQAGAIMLAHNVHHLPVIENKKLIGLVTKNSIYRAIIQQHLVK
ncbi:MAG: CBS domain-containing protein [bacterium]